MSGKLSLCATPIGNLEDITLRVIRTLREADCIYAEDTRHSLGLLNHLELKKPLVSCHQHNERERAAEIVQRVRAGDKIAYISDAGMPGISDPGSVLLRAAREEGIPVEVLPGASALPMSAVLCGLPAEKFVFLGFLPRDKKPRRELLLTLARQPFTMIFYESPMRVADTLGELCDLWGDRDAALMRELTKLHEQVRQGKLSTLTEEYRENPPRGECVIAVAGADAAGETEKESPEEMIARLLETGMRVKDIAKQVSAVLDIPKNQVYEMAMMLSKK